MAGATPFRETPGWAIRAREASRDALEAFETENPEPENAKPEAPKLGRSEPETAKLASLELKTPKLAGPEPETPKLASPEAETPKLATHEPATSKLERSEPESSRAAVTTASERPPLSLAALKAAGIRFRPEEAVAIGQALCRALMTAQLLHRLEPDVSTPSVSSPISAETVFIHPTNRVAVTVADPRDVPAAIQSVGRILSDILPANIRMILDTPILSKAMASPPQFATLEELSQALAAYEELNGTELIQAVYERGEKLVPPPVAPTATDLLPTLSPPDPGPASALRSGYHTATVLAVAIVTAITITGLTGWFLMGRSNAEAAVVPLLQARPIAPPTGPNFPALMPAVLAEKARRADSPNPVMGSAPRPSVARNERPALFAPPPSVVGADRPLMSGPIELTRSRAAAGREPGKTPPARLNAVSGPWPRTLDTPLATYSAKDTDVTPPIPVLPRLLAALEPSSPGVRLDALTIAVVVNGDGTAYSVRAVNEPENMGEYVLLTAALAVVKSWQFRPAMRDGVPVPYQLIVPLRAVTRPAP